MKKVDIDFKNLENIKQRFYVKDIQDFLTRHFKRPNDTVVIIDGLYGTGKTILMQQLAQAYKNNLEFKDKIVFYDIEENDTMDYIYKELDKQEYEIYCLHNITNVSDFIDLSASLADIYARFYGKGIILTGDNSADFSFASHSLFDRKIVFSTNYFPYIEAKQVLNFDIDNYSKYGGLIDKNLIKNNDNFKEYLDKYIIDNIVYGAKKTKHNYNFIQGIPNDKINSVKIIIYEMLKAYSGFLNENLLLNDLKKVNYDISKLLTLNTDYIGFVSKNNSKEKNKQFLDKLEKNTFIQVDSYSIFWLVKDLHILFSELDMRLLADLKVKCFNFDEKYKNYRGEILTNCWHCVNTKKQYNLITPFIRYFLLLKKIEDYINSDNFKQNFNFELTNTFKDKLKNFLVENIKKSIFKDTIVYDILKVLRYIKYEDYSEDYGTSKQERYDVLKIEFIKDNSVLNILDFYIADYKDKRYYLFKIVNSDIINIKNIIDEYLLKSLGWYFSEKIEFVVLYKGESCVHKEFNDIYNYIYLNIDDFFINLNKDKNLEFIKNYC